MNFFIFFKELKIFKKIYFFSKKKKEEIQIFGVAALGHFHPL
jgi:hypothetical protein